MALLQRTQSCTGQTFPSALAPRITDAASSSVTALEQGIGVEERQDHSPQSTSILPDHLLDRSRALPRTVQGYGHFLSPLSDCRCDMLVNGRQGGPVDNESGPSSAETS